MGIGAKIDCGEFFLIFSFGELLILEAKFFLSEAYAEKAVFTANAVAEKGAGMTVDAVLGTF